MIALITGSGGFLGRNLFNKLTSEDNAVIGISRENIHLLDSIIKKVRPDVVFHFAAEIYDESKMVESNVEMTRNIVESIGRYAIKNFVYCGSSSEYGRCIKPMAETDDVNPSTMYEVTKSAGALLAKYCSNKYGTRTRVVRPFSVYGPYEKERRLIPTIYRKYKNNEVITLVPNPVHDWIYVEDFTNGVLKTLTGSDIFDIINIGTGFQKTNMQVIEAFERVLGCKLKVDIQTSPLREFDSGCWSADTRYSQAKYNIWSHTTLEEGIQKYINFMENK